MHQPAITLGISSCLLGKEVRWDGGHKLDLVLIDQLGGGIQYCPVCPEVESGFGVPREPLRLVGDPQAPRLLASRTREDHTERMLHWARRRVQELKGEDLDGFIFKSKSPSCGMRGVRVYAAKGVRAATGRGVFVRVFGEHFPLVPVADDRRLHDPEFRVNFIERISVMKRWRHLLRNPRSRGALVRFHTEHSFLILSHTPRHHRIMENMIARATTIPVTVLYDEYQRALQEAMLLKATTAKHAHCLHHILGYFKKQLPPAERKELREVIDHYRRGLCPLIVPLSLINHYARLYDQPYLVRQHYLHPHP